MVSRLKTYGFLRLNSFFYSIAVSSLGVPLYTSRSSSDDFSSKSVRPPGVFSLRIPQDYRSYCIFLFFALILLDS